LASSDTNSVSEVLAREIAASAGTPLGAGYQARITLHDSSVGAVVVKTAIRRGIFGRSGILREHEVYRRLAGTPGIAKMYGILGDSALVLEYVDGDSLREREAELADRDDFFSRMLQTIETMHAAGVAHCDLKRKDNTLVGPNETPYLIDFGVACILRGSDGAMKRAWFRMMCQMDFNAWVKLRFGRDPQDLPAEIAARYHPLLLERIARWIRIPWQKLTLRRLRKKWSNGR
jgi:predicted Ser/Thr protein kinase